MLFLVLLNNIHVLCTCYVLLKLFPNGACSHWLLLEHVTFSNETVTRQNPLSRPHDKSYDIREKECAITRDFWLQLCNYTVYVFIVL